MKKIFLSYQSYRLFYMFVLALPMPLVGFAKAPITTSTTIIAPANEDHVDFDYMKQNAWRFESGLSQSPIEINTKDSIPADKTPDENDKIVLHIARGGAIVVDNGHTVQVMPRNSVATIRGRHFTMQQFHFHAPSEHLIDGKHYPLEGHFVFKAQDGRLAVVAVLYKEGAENTQFDAIVDAAQRNKSIPLPKFDAKMLLPSLTGPYYHYLGSLTTPPLTENVEWYIFQNPVELSESDINKFKKLYAHNARDPQPLSGRSVLKYQSIK